MHGDRYPHDGSAGDWFYRSTKCDVHARRRRYINNVNYIPVAWVTVSCALSPLLVLFSSADVARAYKSNYLATYLSGGKENESLKMADEKITKEQTVIFSHIRQLHISIWINLFNCNSYLKILWILSFIIEFHKMQYNIN